MQYSVYELKQSLNGKINNGPTICFYVHASTDSPGSMDILGTFYTREYAELFASALNKKGALKRGMEE